MNLLPEQATTATLSVGYFSTMLELSQQGELVWTSRYFRFNWHVLTLTINHYLHFKYDLLISDRTAEKVIVEIGALPPQEERTYVFRGRNLVTGLPEAQERSDTEIFEQFDFVISRLIRSLYHMLIEPVRDFEPIVTHQVPAELRATLAGIPIIISDACPRTHYPLRDNWMRGLPQRLQDALGIPFVLAEG